ncbi:hypothetical protein FK531_18945 [Rhodococcus spelaei]|uniref:Uncharacterized protein n=1 Tax=Rhodococcus spelaei TaxID=2546320 RepID=A0A541B0W7_9NOCA|nr:hypothetical protein [Rhodococcus spelaei]TQF65961.1 hypothetical protein FK531_18945 [Rhodococcus spelaei]
MSVGIGIRIGSLVSTLVVASNEPGTPDPIVIVRDTVLYLCSDGEAVLGGGDSSEDSEFISTLSGFVARVGDPEGVATSDGTRYRAEDVVATAMRSLVRECEPLPTFGGRDGGAPKVVATHPSAWDSETVSELRNSLNYSGLSEVSLVSDAEAACAWFESEVAEQPGQLIGSYHVDDAGATVTLVRSGVSSGRSFRFAAGRGSSPTAQLSSALGAFGWLPSNLDAVVVTADGLVARDAAALRGVANALAEKFGVHCVVGPGPEQAAALGAAILAAGFRTATHVNKPIGLPPSYDVTEVLTAIGRIRPVPGAAAGAATESVSAGSTLVTATPDDTESVVEGEAVAVPAGHRLRNVLVALAAVAALLVLIGVGAAFLLL